MKKLQLIAATFLVLFLSSCMISKKSNMPFVRRSNLSPNAELVSISVSAMLVKPFIIKVLKKEGDYNPQVAAIIKKVKGIKVLTVANDKNIHVKENYFANNNYEELASIINDGNKIKFMAKTNNESIKNLYLLINNDENMVYVYVKGKFLYSDIENMINIANEEKISKNM